MSSSLPTGAAFFAPPFVGGAHPMHVRTHLPARESTLVVDARIGAEPSSSGARRVHLDPPLRGVTALRVTAVDLPLSFHQFAADRNNVFFGSGVDPVSGQGGTFLQVPDGNYTPASLLAALNALALPAGLAFVYDPVLRRFSVTNAAATPVALLWAASAGACQTAHFARDLPTQSLGFALGFRQPVYTIPALTGALLAEAAPALQPLRGVTLHLHTGPQHAHNAFQVASPPAPDAAARVALPGHLFFGPGAASDATLTLGTSLVASAANGLLAADTRTFPSQLGGAHLAYLDLSLTDHLGAPVHLHGDAPTVTLAVTHTN